MWETAQKRLNERKMQFQPQNEPSVSDRLACRECRNSFVLMNCYRNGKLGREYIYKIYLK